MKQYKATAILTKEIEVIFDDDGSFDLAESAFEALELKYDTHDGEIKNLAIVEAS